MATTYFGSKPVSDWTPNGSFESGHDFINQINKQQQDINAKKGEYSTQQGTTNQAQQTYEDAYKGQNAYSDLYKQAQQSEGVDDAKAQYQKSLASVNATNSAMNNLPSSINAGSNVVLNASQRNAALGNQMQKYQNTLDYQTRQNAGDLSQYQTALASAQDLAKTNMSQEQTNVAQAMQNYQAQMNQLNELYNQVLNEKNIMRQIYGDMYDDEYKHMQQEIEVWAQNLGAETQRYAQDQETARNNARIAADRYAADANLRWQKYMDQKAAEEKSKEFIPWLNSQTGYNSIYGAGALKKDEMQDYIGDLAQRYQRASLTNDYDELGRIMSGQTYKDYLNWRGKQ